jgi:hypothetical protein
MAVTVTLKQTRPNTDVAFYNASVDFIALKEEMVYAGTLVDNGGSNNENGLVRTWSLTFTNEEANTAFDKDARSMSYEDARGAYNLISGITETFSYS